MKVPQPIPYQGSKRIQAPKILDYLPKKFNRLVEPFAGSAAISYAVARRGMANQFIINDLNRPLVNLLHRIIDSPDKIAKEYEKIWLKQINNESEYYKYIRELFNKDQRSEYFLFLLARCVKGAVRYNSKGEFNQSPDNRRLGRKPSSMRKEIKMFSAALNGKCIFFSMDYIELFDYLNGNDIIYMDPPYQGTSNKKDSRYLSGLDREDFISSLEVLNKKKIPYLFSYDGRLGNKTYGEELPGSLNLVKIEIETGRSTTSTLNGKQEKTVESLYLSKALRDLKEQAELVPVARKNIQLELL